MSNTMQFALAHAFASGIETSKDEVIQVGGIRFSERGREKRVWRIDPGLESLRKGAQTRSGLDMGDLRGEPTLEEQQEEIASYFEQCDLILMVARGNQASWLKRAVPGNRLPPLIDLDLLTRYLLPGDPIPTLKELAMELGGAPGPQTRVMEYLLEGLQKHLWDLLRSILHTGPSQETNDLLFQIETFADSNDRLGYNLHHFTRIAKQAHAISWEKDATGESNSLFQSAGVSTRTEAEFVKPVPPDTLTYETLFEGEKRPVAKIRAWLVSLVEDLGSEAESQQSHSSEPDDGAEAQEELVRENDLTNWFSYLESNEGGRDGQKKIQERPGQRKYAEHVRAALNGGGEYALEAGTGTGKTIGYLVPGLLASKKATRRQLIVATGTKNLQSQLIDGEFPFLQRRIQPLESLDAALLKGKSNYLCLSALADAFPARPSTKGLTWLYFVFRWIHLGGDIDTIPHRLKPLLEDVWEIRREIGATFSCRPNSCKTYGVCPYPSALRQAVYADLVVTNHHKLPSYARYRKWLQEENGLPQALCIVDEADRFPDHLRSAESGRISERELLFQIIWPLLSSDERSGFIGMLTRWKILDEAAADRMESAARTLREEVGRVSDIGYADWEDRRRWCDVRAPRGSDVPKELQEAMQRIKSPIQTLLTSLERAQSELEGMKDDAADKDERESRLRRVTNYIGRLENILEVVSACADHYERDRHECAYVFEKTGTQYGPTWAIERIPMEIGALVKERLYDTFRTTLFTSATLYVGGSDAFFRKDIGRDASWTKHWSIPSEFDYDGRVRGFVCRSLPEYDYKAEPADKRKRLDQLARSIAALTVAANGRSLVLFTSIREMQYVAGEVKPYLKEHDLSLLVQEGTSEDEIEAFRSVEHSVLFGVDRFWTGVDFPGPTLSQVIIARAPNPLVKDPLISHRKEFMGQPFWAEFYTPVARLKMKQGVGRLMRKADDRGWFIILDSRVAPGGFHNSLVQDLPRQPESVPSANIEEELAHTIERGLSQSRFFAEFESRKLSQAGLEGFVRSMLDGGGESKATSASAA